MKRGIHLICVVNVKILPLRVEHLTIYLAHLAKEFQVLKILAYSFSRFTLDLLKDIKAQFEEWISKETIF